MTQGSVTDPALSMLTQLLDGQSYAEIARLEGLTRGAVTTRVRYIERALRVLFPAHIASCGDAPSVAWMRDHREAYRAAMTLFENRQNPAAPRRSVIQISDADIERVIDITRTKSRHAARDVALLLTLFATGAQPLEIAQLTVSDYLEPDGSVRRESILRADIAISAEARPLYFDSERLIEALDQYLAGRQDRVSSPIRYRGLAADSRLFLTDRGSPMPVVIKHGKRRQCNSILELLRAIFERAGMRGAIATSARRALASKLLDRHCDLGDVGNLLGISKKALRELVVPRSVPLSEGIRNIV